MFDALKKYFTSNVTAPAERVYLDHAAATPMTDEARAVMEEVAAVHFANPSAIHQEGVAAREVVEGARAKLARCLRARSEHVTFSGSGTESNNLAILGTLYALHQEGIAYSDMEIITTPLEHPSVSEACAFAASLGVKVKMVEVNETGVVKPQAVETLLSEKTVLVTMAYINSEIGTIQPLSKIARLVRKFEQVHNVRIYVHADAAQAPYWLPCRLDVLGVDIVSLDAGKCGGPKGVGVLVTKHGVTLKPVLFGGSQERGLRPATEHPAAIVGAVTAIVAAQEECETVRERVGKLCKQLSAALCAIEGIVINGSLTERVANNLNVSVLGVDSEFLTISLDAAGVAASTKSACSGASGGGSKVVEAITGDVARAASTLRLTLGPATTDEEVTRAISSISATIQKLQEYNS